MDIQDFIISHNKTLDDMLNRVINKANDPATENNPAIGESIRRQHNGTLHVQMV